jgi:hypothetical protein
MRARWTSTAGSRLDRVQRRSSAKSSGATESGGGSHGPWSHTPPLRWSARKACTGAVGDQRRHNTAAPTWLLPSAVGVVPVDGDSRACWSWEAGSGLQVFMATTGSSPQLFIPAGQAATEITRSG